MDYVQEGNRIILTNFNSFEIDEILECGQCFRFEKLDDKHYEIIAFGRILNILQEPGSVTFYPCTIEDFEQLWMDYFDLKRDYLSIKSTLYENDIVIRDAIDSSRGIRLLNQDPWETLISFIISQRNSIPHIMRVIKNISEKYGTKIDDCSSYAFPTVDQLLTANSVGLRECRTGYRDQYIIDAVEKIHSGAVVINKTNELSTCELKKSLMEIKGVGNKVADCLLLFGFSRYEYFPADVWIIRIMQHYYFNNNTKVPINEIQAYAYNRFGEYAGFAQQYLFSYARGNRQIFKS